MTFGRILLIVPFFNLVSAVLPTADQEFLPLFIKEYQKFVAGDPMKKKTNMAGMARPDLADDLEKQYDTAIKNK